MGMDAYIFKSKTKKIFKEDDWYDKVEEVWYTRKYWNLIHNMSFIDGTDDCGEFIKLTKDNIEEILQYSIHNPDYWGGFDSVIPLCKILHSFDQDESEGWHYYFEFEY